MPPFSIIVAMDEHNGIGKGGGLAWHLPADLKRFKSLTMGHAVIMGRKTWDSLPPSVKPLPGRVNIVVSRQLLDLPNDVGLAENLDKALAQCPGDREIFVIGGAQIYQQAISHPSCRRILVTELLGDFLCDATFPSIPKVFKRPMVGEWEREGSLSYRFLEYFKDQLS